MSYGKFAGALGILLLWPSLGWSQWKSQTVVLFNGKAGQIALPGKVQTITAGSPIAHNQVYMIYMPEKDRLLMVETRGFTVGNAETLTSDDHGATWSKPKDVHLDATGKSDVGWGLSLTYLGGGKALMAAGDSRDWYIPRNLWTTTDYGESWTKNPTPIQTTPFGFPYFWDPFLVDRNLKTGNIERILASSYTVDLTRFMGTAMAGYSNAGLRVSTNEGSTWGDFTPVPEWRGVSEVSFVRAANGNIVAAGRTDWIPRFHKGDFDHHEGLAVSISKDNGKTWSKLNRLYAWGRHQESMVLLPNGDIVMTYVVRMGYPATVDGYPQYGIEALVSHNNGETWDLDHRYILAKWRAITNGPNAWFAASMCTSTVLLPDGSLLTAYGTGYRALDHFEGHAAPGDIGLVSWRVSKDRLNRERTIADAPWDSNLRNEFNPDPDRHKVVSECPAAPGKEDLATPEDGARASTSPSDGSPDFILHDPYADPILTLETMPAWAEIRWPREHRIDEIHILPGAPMWAGRPSTESGPLDYRLQYQKGGKWIDLIPPATNAPTYKEFYGKTSNRGYVIQQKEFEYIHKFTAVRTKAIRIYITRSSDSGKRPGSGAMVTVPENQRETALRSIEVFEAK